VRTGLMFQEMLRKHDIKVDAARVDEKLKDIASTYQEPEEVIAWYNANPQQKAQIEAVVLEDQLVEYVLGQAKVKEKKVKYEDAVRPAGQQGGAAAESDA
ncbi:MAG: trigger factor, partial [Gammaproteobacteria bacterium]|nr:trigger factor [Gammaproteobacteria bacterium]